MGTKALRHAMGRVSRTYYTFDGSAERRTVSRDHVVLQSVWQFRSMM